MTTEQLRVPITASIIAGLVGATASWGISWGVYSQRLDQHTEEIRDLKQLAQAHDRYITETRTQYGDILRRLEAIDRKLEREREP